MEGTAAASAGASTEEKVAGKIASAGKPVREDFGSNNKQQNAAGAADDKTKNAGESGEGGAAGDGGAGTETPEAKAAREAAEAAAAAEKNKLPDLTDDQKNKILAESLGLKDWDGNVEALKEKLKPVPAAPTAEEKEAQEKIMEKRMLDLLVENGQTPENFVALKNIVNTDLTALSISVIKHELKEGGFSDAEIEVVMKERYYQMNPDELVRDVDNETEEAFEKRKTEAKKKFEYGKKKIESRGQHMKSEAQKALEDLRKLIESKDLLAEQETQFSSKVDEFFSKVPRKMTVQLGKINDLELPPVEFTVSEEDVNEVASILKDPAKRQELFFNEDNSLNLQKVGELMLRSKSFESALKAGHIEGGNRQVAAFEKVFPGSAAAIGLGPKQSDKGQNGRKGVITGAGKPERASFN